MQSASITQQLGLLATPSAKRYVHLVDPVGFEMGYALGGCFPAHAHLSFCDVLFSPGGLTCLSLDPTTAHGRLLIAPPRTFFGPVQAAPFFFMKFMPRPGRLRLPDKVADQLSEGVLKVYEEPVFVTWPWFNPNTGALGSVHFALGATSLVIGLDDVPWLEVLP